MIKKYRVKKEFDYENEKYEKDSIFEVDMDKIELRKYYTEICGKLIRMGYIARIKSKIVKPKIKKQGDK